MRIHPASVAFIVKRAAGKAGLDVMEYAGHSLRAGLATQAAMNGASELAIMKQTGHRSLTNPKYNFAKARCFGTTPPRSSDCEFDARPSWFPAVFLRSTDQSFLIFSRWIFLDCFSDGRSRQ